MQTRERDFVRDFVIGDFVMQTLLSDGVRARIFCTPKLSLKVVLASGQSYTTCSTCFVTRRGGQHNARVDGMRTTNICK